MNHRVLGMPNEVRKFELRFINLNSIFTYSLFDVYLISPVAMKSAEGGAPKRGSVTYSLIHCNGRRTVTMQLTSICGRKQASCDTAGFHLQFTVQVKLPAVSINHLSDNTNWHCYMPE